MTIQWNLNSLMGGACLKTTDLAHHLDMSVPAASRLRVRTTYPRITSETLNGICEFLSCTPGDLILYTPDPKPQDPNL